MKLFGWRIPFTGTKGKALQMVSEGRGGWWPIIRESYAGAWQHNVVVDNAAAMSYYADFACKTLIASDIAKLRVKFVKRDADGNWLETPNPAYDPVLRKPNPYQTRIQFWESWMLSKLNRGNSYILKSRDLRGVVNALYPLDPNRVWPLVADDGSIFYRLAADKISGLDEDIIVPARDIIHDRMNCLFHPLCGIPPLFASGLASQQGLNIQRMSTKLFENNSTPGGILTAPGTINDMTATRIKEQWELNYSGKNVGRVAVLGDGLEYKKMALTAVEQQLIEQLKMTAEVVCSTYHVPPYKIGVGALPSYNNVQALNVEYYSQCLQALIESAEVCLDEGLEVAPSVGTEFDTGNLLRMDSVTQIDMLSKAVQGTILSPNEARAMVDKPKARGGDSPMAQHQMYSLEALAKRDAMDNPFAPAAPTAVPAPSAPANDGADDSASEDDVAAAKFIAGWRAKAALAAC